MTLMPHQCLSFHSLKLAQNFLIIVRASNKEAFLRSFVRPLRDTIRLIELLRRAAGWLRSRRSRGGVDKPVGALLMSSMNIRS